jgi:integrase
MPRKHLTERLIAALAAPDPSGAQTLYWDLELRGFAVLVSGTTNAKSYIIQRDVDGRSRRLKVGAVAELSLVKAKKLAAEMLVDLRKGVDPVTKANANMSLRAGLESYLKASPRLRPASVKVYRQVERYLSAWLDRPIRTITLDMVEKRHRDIAAAHGEITANVSMRTLRIIWNHTADRIADLPTSPVRLKKQWFKEQRRSRMVKAEQLPAFYACVCGLDNPIARDLLLLLMFTGMRKGESQSLRWQDVDLAKRLINLPAGVTKGDRACALPMSDYVHGLLVARRALGKDRYVFPGVAGHFSNLQRSFDEIEGQTGIRISAHDLRRGFATVAEAAGIPLAVLKLLLNHAPSTDVTLGYIQTESGQLLMATQAITNRLKELCQVQDPTGETIAKLAPRK